jgi:hypothetical protein
LVLKILIHLKHKTALTGTSNRPKMILSGNL